MDRNSRLLNKACKYGMLDLSELEKQIEMKDKEKFLAMHKYAISQGSDGMWRTYLPDKEKGRVQKKRKSREALENDIVNYYRKESENPTVQMLFTEWLNRKLELQDIELQTAQRYERVFKQCFGKIADKRVKDISPMDIEDFVLETIHECSLTRKGYSSMRTLLYGIFKRAKKMGLVEYRIQDVIDEIDIPRKAFRSTKKDDSELVFNDEEVLKISSYIVEHPTVMNYGVFLAFVTGLRPGELTSLEWSDVSSNNRYLTISKTEVHYMDSDTNRNVYEVVNRTKTEAGQRTVIIPSSFTFVLEELRRLNPEGHYILEKNGQRIKNCQLDQRLHTICDKVGIPRRSLNKIRKTVATILIDNGVPASIFTSQLGHTDPTTTMKYYHKDRLTISQKEDYIDKAISF